MRLIDARALYLKKFNFVDTRYKKGWNDAIMAVIENEPTVDADPVVHGRWKARDVIAKQAGYGQRYYNHAECKVNPCGLFKTAYDYCPSCGAKMDGASHENL